MEVLRLQIISFRFPSLELPKQVQRVSLFSHGRTETLSPNELP